MNSDLYPYTVACAACDSELVIHAETRAEAGETAVRDHGWRTVFYETDLSMADLCPAHDAGSES